MWEPGIKSLLSQLSVAGNPSKREKVLGHPDQDKATEQWLVPLVSSTPPWACLLLFFHSMTLPLTIYLPL